MPEILQLIAPAGKCQDELLAKAPEGLINWGYTLKENYFSYNPLAYLANNDKHRALSLQQAWISPDPIICLRGGYGCARLLNIIDWSSLFKTQNILIGHSDITALHLAFLKHGLSRTISGIMAGAEFARGIDRDLTFNSFKKCLDGELFSHSWQSSLHNKDFSTKGKIIPVTLSVLCSLLASEYLPDFNESILVLEDINEAPYKLDRMLQQLTLAKIPQQCAAIVMGDFNNCGTREELHSIFADFAKQNQVPVITDLPFGHCLPRLNLPVGAEVELNHNQDQSTLTILRY